MTQSFSANESVYLVIIATKSRGIIRRIDSVHQTFDSAATRQRTMYVEPDALARVEARNLWEPRQAAADADTLAPKR